MAKRKKKKAKAPARALRKKATKAKAAGKRKTKRPREVAEPVADPIKGKFLIEKEGGFLLKLNNLGEQEFSTAGEPSEFVAFPTRGSAQNAIMSVPVDDPLFADATFVPYGKYFGLNHRIDVDGETPKLITSLAWLSTNPVPLKAAVKTARVTLVKHAKEAAEETKAAVKEFASKRKDYESAIKGMQKELATFEKDAVRSLGNLENEEAACEARVDAFDRRFK